MLIAYGKTHTDTHRTHIICDDFLSMMYGTENSTNSQNSTRFDDQICSPTHTLGWHENYLVWMYCIPLQQLAVWLVGSVLVSI